MKKFEIVKSEKEFTSIIKTGKFKKNSFFVIYYKESKYSFPRFGITVPTKVGNAVVRNKIKRIVREVVDKNKNLFQKERDYIIMIRKGINFSNYQELKDKLEELING